MSGFAKNSITTVVSNLIIVIISAITSIIISSALGPEMQGNYSIIILLPTLIHVFLNLGIEPANIYYTANKRYSKPTIIKNSLWIILIFSVLSVIVGAISILILKDTFFKGIKLSYLYISISIAPLTFMFGLITAIFRGEQDFGFYNKVNLIKKIALFLLVLIMLVYPKLWYSIFINIITFLIADIFIFKKIYKEISKDNNLYNKDYLRDVGSYGLKCYLSNVITFFNYRLDTILINVYYDKTQVGLYSFAVSLVEQVWIFSSSVSAVILPKIASMTDEDEKKHITAFINRIITFITLLVVLVLYFASDWFISYVFANKFNGSIIPFKISLIGIFILGCAKILANDIAARGYPEYNTKASLAALVVNAILNLILIPKYGISGAAIATSISYTVHSYMIITNYNKISGNTFKSVLFITKEDVRFLMKLLGKYVKRR